MNILGMVTIDDMPTNFPLSDGLINSSDLLETIYLKKISDKQSFINLMNEVLTTQEQEDLVNNQCLTDDERFPCRYQGCDKSFKYDGKRRRDHELTHNPPPMLPEKPKVSPDSPSKKSTNDENDDAFNYNCSLLNQGLLFMNMLDATAEGDGERTIRCWKFLLLHFKEEKSTTKYSLEVLYLLFQVYALTTKSGTQTCVEPYCK